LELYLSEESVPLESAKSLLDYGIKADDVLMSHYGLVGGILIAEIPLLFFF
jgi:hypothetical protein